MSSGCTNCNNSPSAEFQLNAGRFGLCSTVLNKETGKFEPADETQKMWCCLNTAASSAKMCMDECTQNFGPDTKADNFDNYVECTNNCARIIKSVENICAMSTPDIWRGRSPIVDCIKRHGCGEYPHYNRECIRAQKRELIKCCNQDCMPTSEMSCVDHCNRKYDDFVGKSKDPLIQIFNRSRQVTTQMYPEYKPSKKENSWIGYLIGVAIVVAIVGVALILNRSRSR